MFIGGLCFRRTFNYGWWNEEILEGMSDLTGIVNQVYGHWINWASIEEVEGAYNWSESIRFIEWAESKGSTVYFRLMTGSTTFAPSWLAELGVPVRNESGCNVQVIN